MTWKELWIGSGMPAALFVPADAAIVFHLRGLRSGVEGASVAVS